MAQDGEFVGGCDIVTEMYASGELEKLLQSARAGGKGRRAVTNTGA